VLVVHDRGRVAADLIVQQRHRMVGRQRGFPPDPRQQVGGLSLRPPRTTFLVLAHLHLSS
jgi:hypothetical protein